MPVSSPMVTYAFRLRPGDDLRAAVRAFVANHKLRAGVILTCVGSLTRVVLRHANADGPTTRVGRFEIVSLVGTLDPAGGHLHLCVADPGGIAVGGHLLGGCTVYTTAELVVGELTGLAFGREPDPATGYAELVVRARPG